jgi:acetyl esterase/lipase
VAVARTNQHPARNEQIAGLRFLYVDRGGLVEALRKQGVEFQQLVFPDEIHDFLLTEHWIAAMKAADDFFARKLRP